MTRERNEGMREVILPFVKKRLLETNYEGLGKSDAEEFTRDFNEILDLATKALEQETVSKEVYDHEYFLRKEFEIKIAKLKQQELKIRKEIIAEILFHSGTGNEVIQAYVDGLNKALKILGKYKADSKVESDGSKV